jgi:hypothetical protein
MKSIMFTGDMVLAILRGKKTVTRRNNTNLKVGDEVYVKESFLFFRDLDVVMYKANIENDRQDLILDGGWKSPLYMPAKYSRIRIKIIDIRQENLQDITQEEASREGFKSVGEFADKWNEINAKKGGKEWYYNPLVYRIEFEIIKGI